MKRTDAAEKTENTQEGKMKIGIVVLCAVAVFILMCVMVFNCFIIPEQKYDEAMLLKGNGEHESAYSIFKSLGKYKDAEDICNQYDYEQAMTLLNKGNVAESYYLMSLLPEYDVAVNKCRELIKKYPVLRILNSKPGEIITMGEYEQDGDTSNGAEEIEWIVLDNKNGILYLASKCILDAQVFNTANGDGSSLKQWLKEDFYNMSIATKELSLVSKIGLLSVDDMSKYHELVGIEPEWTPYAMNQEPENHSYAGYSWWLDGEYFHGYGIVDVSMNVVTENGSYSCNSSPVTGKNGVRPTAIIDVTGKKKDYYQEDYNDIENAGVVTRTEEDVNSERIESDSARPACRGGRVGCRTGFHACNENKDGYCVSCCPN